MANILSRLIFTWFLMSLGLWKLSEKMHWEKRWMAWVPGLRYYALADSMEMRAEGIGCGVLEILYYLISLSPFAFDGNRQLVVEALIALAVVVALYVYRIRIFMRLILLFNLKRRWLIFWLLAEWVTLLFLGFDKRYQPHPEVSFQTGWEAGMEPAQITGVSDAMNAATASRKGLSVHLRERTVRELGKKKYLLKDIAMNIPNGSLVLLLGGSGAGKTTFMNAVIGYEKADADIYLNGTNVYKQYGQMKYKIGFVTQTNLVRTHDTVFRTISDAAKLRMPLSVKLEERNERVDEPDSGLDGVIARELFEKLKEIAGTGKIVIVITHTPDRVIDLFDKVIVLAKDSGRVGRLAFYGSPGEAKEFFGRDSMEEIVQCVNRSEEGGEGLADDFIEKYARSRIGSTSADQTGEEVSSDED